MSNATIYWVPNGGSPEQLHGGFGSTLRVVTGIKGLGAPPIEEFNRQYANLPGAAHRGSLLRPQDMSFMLKRGGFADRSARYDDMETLGSKFAPFQQGQIKLVQPDGTAWYKDAYVVEGPKPKWPDKGQTLYDLVVTFRCPWPLWRPGSTTDITGTFNGATAVDIAHTVSSDPVWYYDGQEYGSFAQSITIDGPSSGTLVNPSVTVVGTRSLVDFSLGSGVSLVSGDQLVVTGFPFDQVQVKKNGVAITEYTLTSTLVFPLPTGSITVRLSATSGPANDGSMTLSYYPYKHVIR